MGTPRTNPLLAFSIVVSAGIVYFTLLGVASQTLGMQRPIAEMAHAVVLGMLYVVPVLGAAFLQFALTKAVPAARWWRVVQVLVAALLGPFVAASVVLWAWVAMGGKM